MRSAESQSVHDIAVHLVAGEYQSSGHQVQAIGRIRCVDLMPSQTLAPVLHFRWLRDSPTPVGNSG